MARRYQQSFRDGNEWLKAVALFAALGVGAAALVAELRGAGVPGADAGGGSLEQKLDARREAFTEKAPERMQRDFEQGIEEVAASGAVERAVKAGERAPDFALPAAGGEMVRLGDLLEDGPVVIVWYRGGWCPYCNIQLNAMQAVLPELREAGARMVAISPDLPEYALDTRETEKLGFAVLSDVGNTVAGRYGIAYELPRVAAKHLVGRMNLKERSGQGGTVRLPLAVTYVVDTDGTVAWAFVEADYRKRAEPESVLAAVRGL